MSDSIQIAAHSGEEDLKVLGDLFDFGLLLLHHVISENHGPSDQE